MNRQELLVGDVVQVGGLEFRVQSLVFAESEDPETLTRKSTLDVTFGPLVVHISNEETTIEALKGTVKFIANDEGEM